MEIFLTQRVTTLSAMKAQLLQQSLISAMTGVAKVGAKYTHDVFTADGAFYVEKSFGLFETKVLPGFKATVSSDKLVEKAVLTATLLINQNAVVDAYDATHSLDDFTTDGVDYSRTIDARNALVLSCKVAF